MYKSQQAMARQLAKSNARSNRAKLRDGALQQKTQQGPGATKLKRDPGVPDLKVLQQKLNEKARREAEKNSRKHRHDMVDAKRAGAKASSSLSSSSSSSSAALTTTAASTATTLDSLVAAATASSDMETRFDASNSTASTSDSMRAPENEAAEIAQRRWFFKELKQVIEQSDILLEVLDVRDPLGCRNEDIERQIISQLQTDGTREKRLILVLNKIDLVPWQHVEEWVKYLRRFYPVVAFKSSTQQQHSNLNRREISNKHQADSAEYARAGCVGANTLIQLLKNYSRNLKMKKNIAVGVIGYPNTGKSSLINSLKRSRAAQVGSMPGMTRVLQQIKLDKQVTLIDSPGVIMNNARGDDVEGLLLRNCLRVEQLDDPVAAVQAILRRVPLADLLRIYQLPPQTSEVLVLPALAMKMGKLLQGGVPNVDAVCRIIIQDLNAGKIPFRMQAPAIDDVSGAPSSFETASIVTEWAKEFDIEALLQGHGEVIVEREEEEEEEVGEGDQTMMAVEGHAASVSRI